MFEENKKQFKWIFGEQKYTNKNQFINDFADFLGFNRTKANNLEDLVNLITERYKYQISDEIEMATAKISEFLDKSTIKNKKIVKTLNTIFEKLEKYKLKNLGKSPKYLHFKKLNSVFKDIKVNTISLS